MSWLDNLDFGDKSAEDAVEALAKKEFEVRQARSESHRIHNESQAKTNLLLQQLENERLSNSEDLSGADDFWGRVLSSNQKGQKKVSDSAKSETPVPEEEPIVFKSKKELESWVDRKLERHEKRKVETYTKGQEIQAKLQERLVKENPELLNDECLGTLGTLWNDSLHLNPNIDPEERYRMVVQRTKDIASKFVGELKPNNQQSNRTAPSQPYLGTGVQFTDFARNREPQKVLGYNPSEHEKELKARHQATLSKMFN